MRVLDLLDAAATEICFWPCLIRTLIHPHCPLISSTGWSAACCCQHSFPAIGHESPAIGVIRVMWPVQYNEGLLDPLLYCEDMVGMFVLKQCGKKLEKFRSKSSHINPGNLPGPVYSESIETKRKKKNWRGKWGNTNRQRNNWENTEKKRQKHTKGDGTQKTGK